MHTASDRQMWMTKVLRAAGLYSILFGLSIVAFPGWFFDYFGMIQPLYMPMWQSLGLVSVVFGMGFVIASVQPLRHWSIVLMGFLAKLLISLAFLLAYYNGTAPAEFGYLVFTNGILWMIPFFFILREAYKKMYLADSILIDMFSEHEQFSLDMFETNEGMNLEEMSNKWPTLLIFLRHFGCTFCRESLDEISKTRNDIEIKGTRIVIVHMVDEDVAHQELMKYDLEDIPHISDPECILYKKFKLRKGSLNQLFGLKVWFRGFTAGFVKGHGVGKEMGDGTQMPGVFLLRKGEIIKQYIHDSAADRPDYKELATCNI